MNFKNRGVFVDLETGGLSPHRHGPTQIVAIAFTIDNTKHFGDGRLVEVDRLHVKISPQDYLEYDAIALEMQGETRASLMQEGVTEGTALQYLLDFCDRHLGGDYDGRIWAHEAAFDWAFIRAIAVRVLSTKVLEKFTLAKDRINWTCSKHLFRGLKTWGLVPAGQKENLKYIAQYYGLTFPEQEQHRPVKDTEIALAALEMIMADYASLS